MIEGWSLSKSRAWLVFVMAAAPDPEPCVNQVTTPRGSASQPAVVLAMEQVRASGALVSTGLQVCGLAL